MRTLESIYGDFDGKDISRSICYFKLWSANFIARVITESVIAFSIWGGRSVIDHSLSFDEIPWYVQQGVCYVLNNAIKNTHIINKLLKFCWKSASFIKIDTPGRMPYIAARVIVFLSRCISLTYLYLLSTDSLMIWLIRLWILGILFYQVNLFEST